MLASSDGSRRVSHGSLRSLRQPQTMSLPSSMRRIMSGKIARVVLQVAVGGGNQPAARVAEARGKGGGLPEVSAEADDAPARVALLTPHEAIEAVVGAAVVDGEHFVAPPPALERLRHFDVEGFDVRRFVADGNDDVRAQGSFRSASIIQVAYGV